MNELVSVIIPCYQQGRFLNDVVASLQAQTYTHWEALIINDGSTDETESIALVLRDKDFRVHYISKPNGGLASARNAGLAVAKGDWIQFLDADDLVHPDKIKKQIEIMRDMPRPAVTYTDYYSCDINDICCLIPERYMSPVMNLEFPLSEITQRWETSLSIPVHCFLFDARIFKEYGLKFDESLPNHEDWDCWMRIFSLRPSLQFLNEKLAIYRIHTKSMCHDKKMMRYGFLKAIKKQLKLHVNNKSVKTLLDEKNKEIQCIYHDAGIWARVLNCFYQRSRSFLSRCCSVANKRITGLLCLLQ